jgi:molybdenum cofactor cytidylyltransferase
VADIVDLGDVAAALELGSHELISLVGGGGKTTMLFALGDQLAGRTVLTTTTKMGSGTIPDMATLVDPTDAEVDSALTTDGSVLVWGDVTDTKATGVSPTRTGTWFDLADHVVVEADGSRQRPFKAPAPHEPVIPERSTIVVSVMGADALGRVIWDQCHRPMRVAALAECSPFERLTPRAAAAVLSHPDGARKSVPPGARFAVVINRADLDDADLVVAVGDLAIRLAGKGIPLVVVRMRSNG